MEQSVGSRAFFWQPIAIDKRISETHKASGRICWAPPIFADPGSDVDEDSTSSPDEDGTSFPASAHACVIQCWWRTRLQERRRLYATVPYQYQTSSQAPNLKLASTAAITVQAYWRGTCVRSHIRQQRYAATRIQSAWRHHRPQSAFLLQVNSRSPVSVSIGSACVRLQRAWRAVLARRHEVLNLDKRSSVAGRTHSASPRHCGNILFQNSGTMNRWASSPYQKDRRTSNIYSQSFGALPLDELILHPKNTELNSDVFGAMHGGQAAGRQWSPVQSKLQRRPSPTTKSAAQAWAHQRHHETSGKFSQAIPQGHGQPKLSSSVSDMMRELVCGGWLSCKPHFPHMPCANMEPAASDLEKVGRAMVASCPHVEIRLVARVECSAVASAAYDAVRETLGPERLLWHGTAWKCVPNIVQYGFNRAYAYGGGVRHGSRLGLGTYFAEDPAYALRFCGRRSPRALLLAGVLPGRVVRGEDGIIEPPMDRNFVRYDSTVDNSASPKVFCVFRDFQAIPLFLVEVV